MKENGIEFIPVPKDAHTSLSLINRLCRSFRDMAFNMNTTIVDQKIMNQILDNYNNAPHKTLTEACFNNDSRLKEIFPNGICPNDVYYSGTFGIVPKGVRYLEMAEGYVTRLALDKDNEVIGYEFVSLGKMTDFIKKGMEPNEAYKKAMGHYGRFTAEQGAVKFIDPRKE